MCVCVCVTKPWPRSRTPFPSSLSCRGLIVTLSRIYLFIYPFFLFCCFVLLPPSPFFPIAFLVSLISPVCLFQFVFQFPHKMQIMFSVCYTFSRAQSQIATDRIGLDWIRSGWHRMGWVELGWIGWIVIRPGQGLVWPLALLLRVVCHRFYRAFCLIFALHQSCCNF